MTCHNCRIECKRHGKDRRGHQRYQCNQCRKTFLEPQEKPLEDMYLPIEKAEMVLRLLLEGNSVSSVERLTDVHHTTILKLLVLASEKCEGILGRKLMNVPVRDVQADELWSFIGKKEKRRRPDDDPTLGDCYTFIALETHTKLVLNFVVGRRDQASTDVFIEGLRLATSGQFQHHVERQNLSIRMGLRRFTRLTNAFSKKFENHCAAIMVWVAFYNFCRVHRSLRMTPAMASGIADHVWDVRELLEAA